MRLMRAMERRLQQVRSGADEGIAMVVAMMMMLVVGSMTLAVAAMTLSQMKPTELLQKNVQTVHAAEAGIDAGLGRIRGAVINGVGVRTLLPCNTSTVGGKTVALSGLSAEGAAASSYAVRIRYYASDPADQSAAWRNSNAISCSGSLGPSAVPAFALIESTGSQSTGRTASDGNRSLESVYSFQRTLDNVAGGLIKDYNYNAYCLTASSQTVGASLSMQLCGLAGLDKARQQWAYLGAEPYSATSTDAYPLGLVLVSSLSTSTPLCIEADSNQNKTASVSLQACDFAKSKDKQDQQWSFNDNGQFAGASANGNTNGMCLTSSSIPPLPGSLIVTKPCSGTTAWTPDATVGSGQAGSITGLPDASNGQLVNFKEFGRCFDITSANIDTTFIIDYPCKQAPDPTKVKWNQRESWNPTTKQVKPTGDGAPNKCLTYSGSGPTSAEKYAVFTTCSSTDKNQQWEFSGVTDSYTTGYMIRNVGADKCLGLGAGHSSLKQWSTIVVEPCDGTEAGQKWNAPPNLLTAGKANTREKTGTS